MISHSNVKILITHGAFLSTMGTVYFTKPNLGIPVKFTSCKGYGEAIPYADITEERLKETMEKL